MSVTEAHAPEASERSAALAALRAEAVGGGGRRALPLVAAGAVVVLLAGGAWVFWSAGRQAAPARQSRAPAPNATAPSPPPVATRVWPADRPAAGHAVVTFGGARYAVGDQGDAVVVGDWWCTGRPTAAMLRPSTGEVLAWDGWPELAEDVAGRPVGRVEGAMGLRVDDEDGDGCDELRATLADGSEAPVDVIGNPAVEP